MFGHGGSGATVWFARREKRVPAVLFWGVAALVTIGVGCSDGPDGEAATSKALVRDSMGVSISENVDADTEVTWSVGEEPILTIGESLQAPEEYQFIGDLDLIDLDLIRLPEGGILVADAGDRSLREYDENGIYVRTWGREGEGPGEFRNIRGTHRLGADSVAVWDDGLNRLTVFDMNGELGRTMGLSSFTFSEMVGVVQGDNQPVFREIPVTVSIDPSNIMSLLNADEVDEVRRAQVRVELWDATGNQVAILGPYPGGEQHVLITKMSGSSMMYSTSRINYGRDVVTGVWGSLVIASPNDTYELRAYGSGGSLERIIRLDRVPVPVNEDHVQAWRAEHGGDDVPVASHLPAYSKALGDELGYLWVRDYSIPGEETQRWTVFNTAGIVVTRLETAARFKFAEIGSDYILASQSDDLGVVSVVLLSLDRG